MTVGHPAKFGDAVLQVIDSHLEDGSLVLDPFAGTGLLHQLRPRVKTFGVEIEEEWQSCSPYTILGNALYLPFPDQIFEAVVTSPTWANRMADSHEARDGSRRITYRHTLGRKLHPENSGQLPWGDHYRDFHQRAWTEVLRVLRPGGKFLLNSKNHIRKGTEQQVTQWHLKSCQEIGFTLDNFEVIPAPGMRFGQNHEKRLNHEYLLVFVK